MTLGDFGGHIEDGDLVTSQELMVIHLVDKTPRSERQPITLHARMSSVW